MTGCEFKARKGTPGKATQVILLKGSGPKSGKISLARVEFVEA
jgi:hypothetical protein